MTPRSHRSPRAGSGGRHPTGLLPRTGSLAGLGAALVAASLLSACGTGGGSAVGDTGASGEDRATVVIFAAASLSEVFADLGDQFSADNPGVEVQFSFAGSSDLVAQIESGAPADVFAAADEHTMATLTDQDRIAADPELFASNTLTIVTEPGNPRGITGFQDLADADLSVIVCAPQVPCGAATTAIEQDTGVDLQPVSEENSVTDVLGKITSGQADAGLVYVTDAARAGEAVTRIDFPESGSAVNRYPIGVLDTAPQAELGQEFVDLVRSEQGRAALSEAGFGPGQ